MSRLILIAAVICYLSLAGQPVQIADKDKFQASGVVTKESVSGTNYTAESGILNGIFYTFSYESYGGLMAARPGVKDKADLFRLKPITDMWILTCKKDAIDDLKLCSMSLRDLFISVEAGGNSFISVGSKHFPGSDFAVRIETDNAIKAGSQKGFTKEQTLQILERLKTAKQVTTRYQKWPDQAYLDQTWDLYGFNESFQFINWAVKRLK